MELFYGVLLMLGAILLSNILNRVLPSFSVPVIQIILGIIISLFPSVYHFTLDPELFLILFLAPLLFHDGMHADKKSLWELRKPIIMLGLGLVFFTVLAAGYLIHFMIPSIPLPAAFALAAALAPTDAVAVGSLGKRIKIPDSIMNLLEGEALINDASGIVSFQFAVAAMVTGSFSLLHAGAEFLYVALGGVLIGAVLTGFKYLIVKWVRLLGMENVTFHLLIGILTPFLIFMVAEELHVSGILAVVISGVIHSIESRKLNPELATLKIASKSVWSTLTFILNGLVFVILGMQFPEIINTIWYDISFDNLKIIGYILVITLAMMLIRFLWSYFIVSEGQVEEGRGEKKFGRIKESLVISMSGVRGSVTLATTLSLPFFLNDESNFPQRDLIIFLAAGVILLSLLIANFLLPLFFKEEESIEADEEEREACLEIIESVIKQLNNLVDENNRFEMSKVTRNYILRAEELRNRNYSRNALFEEEMQLREQVLNWETENTNKLRQNKVIEDKTAIQYLQLLGEIKKRNTTKRRGFKVAFLRQFIRNFKRMKALSQKREIIYENRLQIAKLRKLNSQYVLAKLYEKKKQEKTLSINKLIAEYERLEAMMLERKVSSKDKLEVKGEINNIKELPASEDQHAVSEAGDMTDLVSLGFQMERDGIQAMFEAGRISRDTVRKLRNNIALMELQIKNQDF
ncbi:Na+/H+ antiporter [Clostridium sp. KNHs205]|uniref:Na+/H+ antiporter n=1 Tax=Clostridium sp. KNHs205 TaxID=1449050 RepID=UPI00051B5E91|nr:Na+/H+ antiporter [Clostridium sp. KNHs205]